jgi:flavin-binding protein dodecin
MYIFKVGDMVRALPAHKQWGANAHLLGIRGTDPQPGEIFTIIEITKGGLLHMAERIDSDFDPSRFEPMGDKMYTVMEIARSTPLSLEEAVELAKEVATDTKRLCFVIEFPEIVGAAEQKVVTEYKPIKKCVL